MDEDLQKIEAALDPSGRQTNTIIGLIDEVRNLREIVRDLVLWDDSGNGLRTDTGLAQLFRLTRRARAALRGRT